MLSPLIEAHFRQMLRLEDAAVRRLLALYAETQRELVDRLADLDRRGLGDTFTAQHLALTKAQVDAALRVMTEGRTRDGRLVGLMPDLGAAFRESLETGMRQGIAEIADLERRFGDPAETLAARIAVIPPVIPAESVALLTDPHRLLLYQFKGRVELDISRALAQSVLQGEGIDKAIRRLRGAMQGQTYQLERIARTEIAHAMNHGHLSAIQSVADEFPEMGLKKQWSAHLDQRSSKRCISLDGDVADAKGKFTATDGWEGFAPPAHPNCRSRVNAYSERWREGKQQRTQEQKDKLAELYGNGSRDGGGKGAPDGGTLNERARKSEEAFRRKHGIKTDAEYGAKLKEEIARARKAGKLGASDDVPLVSKGKRTGGERIKRRR